MGFLESTDLVDETQEDPAMHHDAMEYSGMLLQLISTMTDNAAALEQEHELRDVLADIGDTATNYVTHVMGDRRRRTATSSTMERSLRPSTSATKETIETLANEIRDNIDQVVLARGVDARADTLREVVIHMIEDRDLHAARMRVMAMLLAHYLPQPGLLHPVSAAAQGMGRAIWRDSSQWLHEAFHANFDDYQQNPVQGEVGVRHLSNLSPMAIEMMSFLEGTSLDMSSIGSTEGASDEIPLDTAGQTNKADPLPVPDAPVRRNDQICGGAAKPRGKKRVPEALPTTGSSKGSTKGHDQEHPDEQGYDVDGPAPAKGSRSSGSSDKGRAKTPGTSSKGPSSLKEGVNMLFGKK